MSTRLGSKYVLGTCACRKANDLRKQLRPDICGKCASELRKTEQGKKKEWARKYYLKKTLISKMNTIFYKFKGLPADRQKELLKRLTAEYESNSVNVL